MQLNPYTQLRNWHPKVFAAIPDRYEALDMADPMRFEAFVRDVLTAAEHLGITIVIRDYNYVDYCGVPFSKPSMRSSLLDALGKEVVGPSVVVNRHPLRQYRSLCAHEELRDVLTPEIFLAACAAFRQDFRSVPTFHYEEFVKQPRQNFEEICRHLRMPYDPLVFERFATHDAITGNLLRSRDSAISETPAQDDERTVELREDPRYGALLRRFGYNDEP